MPSNDDDYSISRTPSGWHDDARNRDAGHDEMQFRVWRELTEMEGWSTTRTSYSSTKTYYKRKCYVEFPFVSRGRIIGFADIAVRFSTDERDSKRNEDGKLCYPFTEENWWFFYELKPIIGSVGAVMRQCTATDFVAQRAGLKDCDVYAIAYEDDPKAALLNEMWPLTILLNRKPSGGAA